MYSYNLDDAGISSSEADDLVDEDEDSKKKEVSYKSFVCNMEDNLCWTHSNTKKKKINKYE